MRVFSRSQLLLALTAFVVCESVCPKALQHVCSTLSKLRSVVTKILSPITRRASKVLHLPSFTKISVTVAQPSEDVEYWTLVDKRSGTAVTISTLGATIVHLFAPAADGTLDDIVLGFDDVDTYHINEPYFGSIVGRVANRIAGGRFSLGGETYSLAQNNGPNCLHGGVQGFHRKVWSAEEVPGGVQMTLTSPDGDEGFPGVLNVTATYTLQPIVSAKAKRCRLVLEMVATVPPASEGGKPTPVNLAQHSYFNLAGHKTSAAAAAAAAAGDGSVGPGSASVAAGSGLSSFSLPTVDGHKVFLSADAFTTLDADQVPTGEIAATRGSVMDLSSRDGGALLGPKLREMEAAAAAAATVSSLEEEEEALSPGGPAGFDHNFVLRSSSADTLAQHWYSSGETGGGGGSAAAAETTVRGLHLAAVVVEPVSGRTLTVETSAPGVQFYTGNFLDQVAGKGGAVYGRHSGLCLETQHFPSSVDEDSAVTNAFDAVGGAAPVLVPGSGDSYHHVVAYSFGTVA